MNHLIAPSILSADFGQLQEEVEMLNQSAADWIHVDIMDGVFVPNLSFGFPVLNVLQHYSDKPLDVHLMISRPEDYLERFKKAGAANLTVHYETCPHLHRTIQTIKAMGCRAGVAINPHTPVTLLKDIIAAVDLVCLMSVNPGFGGQAFIDHTYRKLEDLKMLSAQRSDNLLIEVDGGVDLQNASLLLNEGANVLVAGHTIFGSKDPKQTILKLKQLPH